MTTATTPHHPDPEAIAQSLRVLVQSGDVIEVRIPNTGRTGTVSGYFDDLQEAAAHAEAWSGRAPGVYITLNPVKPALLARAKNRLEVHAKTTTPDGEIQSRRWLLLDFDSKRPAGISATDAEHEAALAMAKKCRMWLRSLGWPNPVLADSGNGGHLLYRVSLPNDPKSTELIKRVTEAVSFRFSDDATVVDLTTVNPARITKVYGTLAAKGDDTSERPHRYSRLVSVPKPIRVVSRKLLKKMASLLPKSEPSTYGQAGKFDLEKWIIDHQLQVAHTGDWNGGRKWVLDVCPWNPEHTNRSAYIVRLSNGAIGAGCHHNGCAGKGWHDLRDAVEPGWRDNRKAKRPDSPCSPYFVEGGRVCRRTYGRNGKEDSYPLCNFVATIIREQILDDGSGETETRFAVQGTLSSGQALPVASVRSSEFAALNWPLREWGARPIIKAGQGSKDCLREAIQELSGDVGREHVYQHIGWRKVDGRWLYLHAAGAIGPDGPVLGILVSLPDALVRFDLPEPANETLAESVRASLRMIGLGSGRITFPTFAAVGRAVLGGTDFTLHLSGPTGVFKTELAALAQQHFGLGMDSRHLPASWSSTGNSLEATAFLAKDALLVVDDFAPTGTTADVQRCHREADRLLRAQGNSSGRQRLRADSTLRAAKPPRGLILSTGEDVPRGQSLRARALVLEISADEIDREKLTHCQRDAAAGLYVQALAGFIRWLAPQYQTIRDTLRANIAKYREKAQVGTHARTSGIVAELYIGLRYFLSFAVEVGAITTEQRKELCQRAWKALLRAAKAQKQMLEAADPVGQFFRLLVAALASGRAYCTNTKGTCPEQATNWGWCYRNGWERHPSGKRIGWVDGADLYLEAEAAYAEVQELARAQGDTLAVSSRTLHKRMKDRGLIVSTEAGKLLTRRKLEGRRRFVLHLAAPMLQKQGEQGVEGDTTKNKGKTPYSGPLFSANGQKQGAKIGGETQEKQASAPKPPKTPVSGAIGGRQGYTPGMFAS
jgi:hypothetical protein